MEPAATLADLHDNWVGRYLAGRTFVYFCADEQLFGTVLWGRPNAEDVDLLVRAYGLELRASVAPHSSVIDARHVDGADIAAFAGLTKYVAQNRAALAQKLRRLALVRPDGFAGAVVSGFFVVVDPPTNVAVFSTPEEAFRWLGRDEPALVSEVATISQQAAAMPAIVASLRTVLATRLHERDGGPAEAAHALGVSERTLQRRLKEAGTNFRDELTTTRIRVAMTLLRDTDIPMTRVALDAGFASVQHFSTTFRRATGQSPRAWREAWQQPSGGTPA